MNKLMSGSSLVLLSMISGVSINASAQEAEPPEIHDHGHDIDVVFATASPHQKSRFDVLQGSNILSGDELDESIAGSIGETLSGLPGVSSTFFGPGASRPIIRGLGGDRIRVLINGIGSIDAASTSPDHAVAGDPLTAERIEIMRGASTLLYGSNAVGGVVNIIDNRIPIIVPDMGATGKTRLSIDTVSNDRSGGGAVNVALSENVVLHVDGYYRRTGNYSIPGFSESAALRALEEEGEHEEQFGSVENSDVDNKGGTFGAGWIGENANFGVSFNINDSDYGVPGHGAHGEEEVEGAEEAVRINLDQKRFDLKGNLYQNFLVFEEARLRFGYADYKHIELEGAEQGTSFNNKGWEGRFELIQKMIGDVHGSMGIQLRDREFSAIGEEAFVPPNDTFQWGIFAVEEIEVEPVTFEFGARYDHQNTISTVHNMEKSFHNFSFSGGAAIHIDETDLVGISVSRSERSPTPEELFSNGPHLATNAYERGNLNLGTEKALSAELTLKRDQGPFSGSFNLYHTWYQDFIYEHETGLEMEGLSLLEFRAKDAKFYGAELEIDYTITEQENYSILLGASGDFTHARFTDGAIIPRIPATSATLKLEYQSDPFNISGKVRFVGSKTKTAAGILPTDDYTSFDLSLTWRPLGFGSDLDVRLQALNITNTERRQHTSFLKDLVPMPGRNFKLSLDYGF
ncbi:MAG: TonB-dependent receptor [Kordiimonadaceae bacterium]|jgi:iron complex outermembrane recepter protein|nr:TonB-dependent receptor [Kordiimonadaceae bacterium]MBT6035949.1 TonB-dependent receptor [Kordiimonadaceae bacterium]MBT6329005.1 TonB-dependent receptor [Kordiimonadaceae bacterium]MBT7583127.1 TonB-dependent receptor [Kordiimonadaceae bacterium]